MRTAFHRLLAAPLAANGDFFERTADPLLTDAAEIYQGVNTLYVQPPTVEYRDQEMK